VSGTAAVRFKKALAAAVDALPGMEGVKVGYGWDVIGREQPREVVYFGRAEWDAEPLTFAPAGGRYGREENGVVQMYVAVRIPGGTQEDAETRAVEIGTVFEEWLATNPSVGLPDVKLGHVEGGLADSDPDDEGTTGLVNYRVGFMSVLD
jgi:hypothetical protein